MVSHSARRALGASLVALFVVVGGVAQAPTAAADPPHGPAYPPPGGVTLGSSGNAGRAGGFTWTYSAIDRDAFTSLWWGPAGSSAAQLALDGTIDAPGETLAFDPPSFDPDNGAATFTGSSTLHFFQSGGWQSANLPTRLRLAIPGGTLIDATSVEIEAGVGAVHPVEADYSANFIFEALWQGTWRPVLDLYDSLNTDPARSVRSSFSGGFYWPNRAPVADDQDVATDEDTPLDITLTGSDPDEEAFTFAVVDGPANGTLSGEVPNLVYTPDPDFNGVDAFTFSVSDAAPATATGTVNITVTPVNDAPVSQDQDVTTDEDVPVEITLVATDVDGDELSFSVVDAPAGGTLSGEAPVLVYTPDADYNGSDSFTFVADDGELSTDVATVSITINPVNDAPRLEDDTASVKQYAVAVIDVLANDNDVEGDPLTIDEASVPAHGTATVEEDGTITYRPDTTFKGSDTFTYTVSDGNGGVSTANVTVLEDGCGEDGPVSGPVDLVVEPAIGSQDPYMAASVHDFNCSTVVELEEQLP